MEEPGEAIPEEDDESNFFYKLLKKLLRSLGAVR